jgi:hypothetical protein
MYAAEMISNQFAGPPLGAMLFVAAAAAPFFLDSVSFVVSALLILSFTGTFVTSREEGAPRKSLRADIGEGLRWNHRLLRTLAIMLGIWNGIATAGFAICRCSTNRATAPQKRQSSCGNSPQTFCSGNLVINCPDAQIQRLPT